MVDINLLNKKVYQFNDYILKINTVMPDNRNLVNTNNELDPKPIVPVITVIDDDDGKFVKPSALKDTGSLTKPSSKVSVASSRTIGSSLKDIDALDIFKRTRSTDKFSSSHLVLGGSTTLDKRFLLSKGQKTLKSALAHQEPAKKKTKSSSGKGVRFVVDSEGLDVATIRVVPNQDEAPVIPLYATAYLNITETPSDDDISTIATDNRIFRLGFDQPANAPDFMIRALKDKVVLESCVIHEIDQTVSGTVRVANISFNKHVVIRYTCDGWATYGEVACAYVYYGSDKETDRFAFYLSILGTMNPGQVTEFCIRYETDSQHYWDNNEGENYKIFCQTSDMIPTPAVGQSPSSTNSRTWLQYL